jgi:hypothetical protein
MTIIKTTPWGSTILFSVTFYDEAGDPIAPTDVTIRVRQGRKSVEADMTPESEGFSYRLETDGFKPGQIFWALDATGGGPTKVSEDGSIVLTANPARAAAA